MNKATHTQGPWAVDIGKNAHHITAGHKHIASVTMVSHYHPHDANARLIASAPELLEALEECYSALEGMYDDNVCGYNVPNYRKYEDVIAKAKGE